MRPLGMQASGQRPGKQNQNKHTYTSRHGNSQIRPSHDDIAMVPMGWNARQTGLYAGIKMTLAQRTTIKKAASKAAFRTCDAGTQRCEDNIRAWLAALFSAATGGVLPSSASSSSRFRIGRIRL